MKKYELWTRADLEAEVHALHTRYEAKVEAAAKRRTKARAAVYDTAIGKLKDLIAKSKNMEADKLADEAVSVVNGLEGMLGDQSILFGNGHYFYNMARLMLGLPVPTRISDRTTYWSINYHLKEIKAALRSAGVEIIKMEG